MKTEGVKPLKLRLNTLPNARKSLARILRDYNTGKISEAQARTNGYMFEKLLQYWKTEMDMRIEERLDALEALLEGK